MPGTEVRALIVDDEADMRALMRATIRRANEGLMVAGEVTTGEEALVTWREERPDIVLLDHRMPGLSGLEVAERMLSEDPEQNIILFSAYLDDNVQRTANELGIKACLPKRDVRRLPDLMWSIAEAS